MPGLERLIDWHLLAGNDGQAGSIEGIIYRYR